MIHSSSSHHRSFDEGFLFCCLVYSLKKLIQKIVFLELNSYITAIFIPIDILLFMLNLHHRLKYMIDQNIVRDIFQ